MWGEKLAWVKIRRWIMTNFISSTDGNLHDSSRDLSMHRALDPVDLLAALSSSQALFPLVDWIRFSWIQVRKKPATFGIHFILYWDNQHVLSNHQCTTENCPILLFLNPNNCHVLIFEPLRSFPAILPVKTPNTHRIPIYTLYILQLRKDMSREEQLLADYELSRCLVDIRDWIIKAGITPWIADWYHVTSNFLSSSILDTIIAEFGTVLKWSRIFIRNYHSKRHSS